MARVRVARPTDRLEAPRRFYGHGLGLVELGSSEGHARAEWPNVKDRLAGRPAHTPVGSVGAC